MSSTPRTYDTIDAQIVRYRDMYWEVADDIVRDAIDRAMTTLEYERFLMQAADEHNAAR